MHDDDKELPVGPSAPQDPVVLKNREATAIYLGFGNALHDAIHAGILSSREVITLMMVAGQDAAELLFKGSIELRGHEGQRVELEGQQSKLVDDLIHDLAQTLQEAQALKSDDGLKVANYIPDKKVVN